MSDRTYVNSVATQWRSNIAISTPTSSLNDRLQTILTKKKGDKAKTLSRDRQSPIN